MQGPNVPPPPVGSQATYTQPPEYPFPQYGKNEQPKKPRMSYWQFLLRTVTIAATVPGVVFFSALAFLMIFGAIFATLLSGPEPTNFATYKAVGGPGGGQQIVVIDISGAIVNEGSSGLFALATTNGFTVKEVLQAAAEDPNVGAVVLEMSTPGGTIPASIAISQGVESVKAAGKPVVTHVHDLMASGGMWAAAKSDAIVANAGSLVGSIGVISGPYVRYRDVTAVDNGLLGQGVETTGGVEQTYITAGRGKDLGNPFRDLTPEELAFTQQRVDGYYIQFVEQVSQGRGITAEQVREMGAFVYPADEAKEIGLVNEIGSLELAWEKAAEIAGLQSYTVVRGGENGGGGLFSVEHKATPGSLCATTAMIHAYHGDLLAACAAWGKPQ